jgi:hypothetical protein
MFSHRVAGRITNFSIVQRKSSQYNHATPGL